MGYFSDKIRHVFERILPEPITTMGIVLVSTVIGTIFVYVGIRYNALTPAEADMWLRIFSIYATVGLALGILTQASQNEELLDTSRQESIISQESEWMPEVRHSFRNNIIKFNGRRPWYPWFKIRVDGQSSQWAEEEIQNQLNDAVAFDWVVEVPETIQKFLALDVDAGIHTAELFFRFESMTGEEYFFIYHIEVEIGEEAYSVLETPSVDRLLPWRESDMRDKLKNELEEEFTRP